MKYAVIGSAGQLGRDLCPRLEGDAIPLTRADADLTSPDALRSRLAELRPDVVINCAAYNLVDKAENEPEAAFAVNAWGVRNLALVCCDLETTLVHFSTDYVFGLDEQCRQPLAEDDAPGPVSVYGLSKLTGEYLVRSICPKHFVIRTCGLYGHWGSGGKGTNFVETMLKLAGQGKSLKVVNDQHCTPSYTVDIAEATTALIATNAFGLYHLTNAGSCTWFQLAQQIFEAAGLSVDLSPTTSNDYGAPARRPGYSVLGRSRCDALGLKPLRSWQGAVEAYLAAR